MLTREAITYLGNIFGTVKARTGWRQLFGAYLDGYEDAWPSKGSAIQYVLTKFGEDTEGTRHFIQLLINEHVWVLSSNRTQINDRLRLIGLYGDDQGILREINPSENSLGGAELLFDLIKGKEFFKDIADEKAKSEFLKTCGHHLSKASEHLSRSNWDDMSSQLRKLLEYVIVESTSWVEYIESHGGAVPDQKITTKQNKPTIKERLEYLGNVGYLTPKEVALFYDIYGYLSEQGAHPGVPEKESAEFKKNITLEGIRYYLNRL